MSDGLCWKCREAWGKVGESWGHMIPFQLLFCPHEPKEKLKCWCKIPPNSITGWPRRIESQTEGMYSCPITFNFCPECGRELSK